MGDKIDKIDKIDKMGTKDVCEFDNHKRTSPAEAALTISAPPRPALGPSIMSTAVLNVYPRYVFATPFL